MPAPHVLRHAFTLVRWAFSEPFCKTSVLRVRFRPQSEKLAGVKFAVQN